MKVLVTVEEISIAPRFDLTTEIVIVEYANAVPLTEARTIILPRKSAEELSDLIVKEGIDCLICGGIEDSYYTFFLWRKISVIDGVIGSWAEALELVAQGRLKSGQVLASAKKR